MRTPNCKCVICSKPLYRRPGELAKVRHVACMAHRTEAQRKQGLTDAQKRGLSCGRKKGTNNRTGYKHKEASKRKTSQANKRFWKEHPEQLRARGEKTRGPNHYRWKGGSSRLNTTIRRMREHRKWADAVRERDGCCLDCGAVENLESHHITELAVLVSLYGVKNRTDARACDALWDIDNGETLCQRCHCRRHGRKYTQTGKGRRANKRKDLSADAS